MSKSILAFIVTGFFIGSLARGIDIVPPDPSVNPKKLPPNRIEVVSSTNQSLPKPDQLPANDKVVVICYTHDPNIERQCKGLKRMFESCGISPVVLENKSIAEIRKELREKKLPPNTNVFIGAHGITWSGRDPAHVASGVVGAAMGGGGPLSAAGGITNMFNETHYIGVPPSVGGSENVGERWRVRMKIKTDEVNVPTNVIKSADLFQALDEELGREGIVPAKIFGACFGGKVLSEGTFRNTMTMASWDQEAFIWSKKNYMTDLEHETAKLLCRRQAFQGLDTNANGYLSGEELATHFKKRKLPRPVEGSPETPVLKEFTLYPVTAGAIPNHHRDPQALPRGVTHD